VNKKENGTVRNAVSRVVYAKRLPRSLEKRTQKRGTKGDQKEEKSQRVYEESQSCLSTCFIVS